MHRLKISFLFIFTIEVLKKYEDWGSEYLKQNVAYNIGVFVGLWIAIRLKNVLKFCIKHRRTFVNFTLLNTNRYVVDRIEFLINYLKYFSIHTYAQVSRFLKMARKTRKHFMCCSSYINSYRIACHKCHNAINSAVRQSKQFSE